VASFDRISEKQEERATGQSVPPTKGWPSKGVYSVTHVRVTVCVPTYNQVAYLRECLESVLSQEFVGFRVLVLDDCSTDGTQSFMSRLQDTRIRYLRNGSNIGAFMNWRQALWNIDTEYFAVFQHDDVMLPRYLSATVAELDRQPRAAIAFTLAGKIDELGHDLNRSVPRDPPPEGLLTGESYLRYIVEGRSMIITPSSILMRRSCVAEVGNYDCPHSNHTFDTNLLIRLAARFAFIFINERLCMNRTHPGQLSKRVLRTRPLATTAERIEALAHLMKLEEARSSLDLGWCAERLLHLVRRASEYADYLVPERNISWHERRSVIIEEITQHVPQRTPFVVIGGNEFALDSEFHDRAITFKAVDGVFWGAPVDDHEASVTLDGHLRAGRRYLVIVRPAFWWIDYYIAFRRRLFEEWTNVCATSSLMIYRHPGPARPSGHEPESRTSTGAGSPPAAVCSPTASANHDR
jgi:glycosyltransferase involved in cell wall biosynthesis